MPHQSAPGQAVVVLLDSAGPVRTALAHVLETVLNLKIEARPREATQSAAAVLDFLKQSGERIRTVILDCASVITEPNAAHPCDGLGLLKGVIRQGLAQFPVVVARLPREAQVAQLGESQWRPDDRFLAEASYQSITSVALLADLLTAIGRALATSQGGVAERLAAFKTVRERVERDDRREYEVHAQSVRHRYLNSMAAARLLFGAYAVGDIKQKAFERALAFLRAAEHGNSTVSAMDLERLEHLGSYLRGGRSRDALTARIGPKERILVVDDQWETAGWCVFFEAILGQKVCHAKDPESALAQVKDDGENLALVCLDLCLPDDPEKGLDLLREIKRVHLDLPVLVFSGVDQIRYARSCLNSGAAQYYVKQLVGPDRASIDYYERFREMIEACLARPRSREIWLRIDKHLPQLKTPAGTEGLLQNVLRRLRRAYYFFTADEDDPRARLIFRRGTLGHANVYWECHVECRKIVELLVRDRYEDLSGSKRSATPAGRDATVGEDDSGQITFRKRVQFLKKQRDAAGRPVFPSSLVAKAFSLWEKCSPFNHPIEKTDQGATEVLEEVLDFAELFFLNCRTV